jgi:NADPH:quinone reductase-like Zn-dependent oxidoreductase
MTTVEAARLCAYGEAEAVRIEDVSLPDPKTGELLIRVNAAGVNPVDWKIRAGHMQQAYPLQLPVTLGGDFAGVVEAVDAGVAGLKAGDAVYGQAPVTNGGSGSFAEAVLARAGTVAAKPRSVSYVEAGALPVSAPCRPSANTCVYRLVRRCLYTAAQVESAALQSKSPSISGRT